MVPARGAARRAGGAHGTAGERAVPAREFFQGYYTTTASPDEMITELWFPRPSPHAVLTEFAPRQGDFAVVAAAVSADVEDGTCRSGRVVLGGVGPLPVEVDAGALAGQPAGAVPGRPWASTPRARSTRRTTRTGAASTGAR